jgi:hypothetical protein
MKTGSRQLRLAHRSQIYASRRAATPIPRDTLGRAAGWSLPTTSGTANSIGPFGTADIPSAGIDADVVTCRNRPPVFLRLLSLVRGTIRPQNETEGMQLENYQYLATRPARILPSSTGPPRVSAGIRKKTLGNSRKLLNPEKSESGGRDSGVLCRVCPRPLC